ncbi:universal stress protein [Mycobacterium sp. Y57]|uniref:universal stress protein n=1 Tax=Mycolicibacterium xanthum TaxID=2796469 RepID=UPI001C84E507|nr:universal stress protein [Mycolicibacterium xanthum]MBX7431839.1 universal stress protein [Mycolicibacterium xanthum]
MTAQSEHTSHNHGIVVAVDGSSPADDALTWAVREAALRATPLTLVHVVPPPMVLSWPGTPATPGFTDWQREEGEKLLKGAIETAEKLATDLPGTVSITSEMFFGGIISTLMEMSEDADLLVVGCRGVGAMSRAVLGSVSSAMVHHARCPVAVIHDDTPLDGLADAPVVVGVDGSPASEAATAIAFDEASRRGVVLVSVHAWSDTAAIEYPGITYETMQGLGEEVLGERLAGWSERYPDVEVRRVVACDRPAHQILEEAEKAQLVVVGSHGRGGFTGMLLGSVSTKVIHGTKVPVIVARGG